VISPNASRLKHFAADQTARTVKDLQLMIGYFENTISKLEAQIQTEAVETRNNDRTNASYSLFAKSARTRCEKLRSTADGLRLHLEAAIQHRNRSAGQLMPMVGGIPQEMQDPTS
jgi:hypothetical protein